MDVSIHKLNLNHHADSRHSETQSVEMYRALLDTGASSTCISQRVVDEIELSPTGKTMLIGATGRQEVDQYSFGVGLLVSQEAQPSGDVRSQINVRPTIGTLFQNDAGAFDVLLGRDILCSGVFTISFDGHFTLSH